MYFEKNDDSWDEPWEFSQQSEKVCANIYKKF